MENDNNFTSACKKYLFSTRHIKEHVLNFLEEKNLITYHEDHIAFVMKDLDGNVMGIQERYLLPIEINGKLIKSKTKSGTHVWYFYADIDYTKPVIITEWEIDFLTLDLPNVIGLQGIWNLRKFVDQLKEKRVQEIYILTDKDQPSDVSISKLLDLDISFLAWVFDCRGVLWSYKDVNEYIVSWSLLSGKI